MVNDKSRMNREIHVRFRESLRVKLFWATRLGGWGREVPVYSIMNKVSRWNKYGVRVRFGKHHPISLEGSMVSCCPTKVARE